MNSNMKMKNPVGMIRIIFGIIGLGLMIGGIIFLVNRINYMDNAVVIEAEITDIESYRDSDGDRHHTVYVTYEYEGKEYEDIRLSEYSSSMQEGKTIEIYIDKTDATDVHTKSMFYFGPIMLMGMGGIFVLVAVIFIIVSAKKKNRIKKLVNEGVKIYGEVQGGFVDNTYTYNGRHPYKFNCVYHDQYSGQPVICTSDRTWEQPDFHIGKQVLIYVDKNDRSNYYVDLESINNSYGG